MKVLTYEGDALKIIAEDCDGSLRKGVENLDFLRHDKNTISPYKK